MMTCPAFTPFFRRTCFLKGFLPLFYGLFLFGFMILKLGGCFAQSPEPPAALDPFSTSTAPLVVYIRDSFYQTCAPVLQKATPRPIRFVKLGGSLLMGRLRREKGATPADVVIGADSCLNPELTDLGVVGDPALPPDSYRVPVPWAHPKIVPFSYGYLGFLYHAARLKNPPTRLAEVLDSDLKILMPHPRTSTVGLVFLEGLKHQAFEANPPLESTSSAPVSPPFSETWGRFEDRLFSLPKGLSEAFALFMAGEADLLVAYTTSAVFAGARHAKSQVRALPLPQAPFHAYTAFLTPRGQTDPEAQALLKALLAPPLQRAFIDRDCLYPVNPALQQPGLFPQAEPAAILPQSAFTRTKRRAFLRELETLSKERAQSLKNARAGLTTKPQT